MTRIKKLFALPVYRDEVETRQAYLLNIILWVLICVPIPFVIYTAVLESENFARALTQAAAGETVNIFLLFLLRRKYVRAASILQVSAFWLFFTVTAVTGAGVKSEAYLLGYTLVITIAGILLGGVGSITFACLSLLAGVYMVYAQIQGDTLPRTNDSLLTTWMVSAILFPIGTMLQYLASRTLRNALARAQASEEKYRLISQVSSDYTFSTEVDRDGNLCPNWVAGAFEKMTGYTFEEYLAAGGWLAQVHPDDVGKDAQDMENLRKNQDVQSEIRTFTKSGEIRWNQVFAHPIWDATKDRLIGIIGAVRDITKQKRIEADLSDQRDFLQIFMDNVPDTVWFKDAESRFIRINQAQARLLNIEKPQDAIGKTDLDFQDPKLAQEFIDEEKQIFKTNKPVLNRIEYNPTRDGEPRWLTTTKVPVKDKSGKFIGIIGVSRDVTEQKRTESMLAYERDILQIFMDNFPDNVYFKDTESRFIRINQGQARFLGIESPEDAIGKTDFDFQDPEFARKFFLEEKQIMETGEPVWNRVEVNRAKDGPITWFSTTKVPARNEAGQIIGTIGISRNITEQKKAEELEQQRRGMLENIIKLGKSVTAINDLDTTLEKIWHGIHNDLQFDRLGIFLYNPEKDALDRALGTDNFGNMVKAPGASFPIKEQSKLVQILNVPDGFYFTRNYSVETNIPEGSEMYGVKDHATLAVWMGDKPVAVICVDRLPSGLPITPLQLEALRLFGGYIGFAIENARLNSALENELELKKEIIIELETKNAELERFTYTVSHDLKSPLVTIRGFLGYLERDAKKGDFEKLTHDKLRIESAVEKMQNLLNDLLELSRIGRLTNPLVEIPFNDLVRDVLEILHGQIEAGHVCVEYKDNNTIIKCDQIRIMEVLQNLIDNAVKFMGNQPEPKITIGMEENENNATVFFVRDNGIGIEKQYHDHIFDLFNKLNAGTEGTGIGLTLIKRIIEMHNGRIWLESEPGKGTTFYFTLNQG